MSKAVKIIDKAPQFISKVAQAADQEFGAMAMDIEKLAKMKVPQKTGGLQSKTVHKREGLAKFKVKSTRVYARYQEFGGDGRRRVRNYSSPGTGPKYLRGSGDTIVKQAMNRLKATFIGVRP